jgi:hypothetical protein
MRIFKNQNEGRSELFGDKVERLAQELSAPSWLENFARKQAGSEQNAPNDGSLIRNRLLGSHQVDAGGHIGSLQVKGASDTLFGQKDPPQLKAAEPESEDTDSEVESPLPTSAERLSMHVASTSSPAAGRGLIRNDSVSIFDKDAFSHIEDKKLEMRSASVREPSRPSPAVGSRSISEGMFDRLSASNHSRRGSSSDVGAVERMFKALKGDGVK